MAVWQCSFFLVPKQTLLTKYQGVLPQTISEDDFDNTQWFTNYPIERFLNSITYLTPNQHFSDEVLFWGDYDTDTIQVNYDDNKLAEIYCRIDFRKDYEYIVKQLFHSMAVGQLAIINSHRQIIEKEETLLIHIQQTAQRYLYSWKRENL